ncbi:MAG: hypothetical protein HRT68_10095 [Flavobacteriaceae bacterium]|nr:hypothetical protein [Flavobacteriaceae bacterium]
MNKFKLVALFLFVAFGLSAQNISDNAIGLRFGDSDGLGVEISYQRALFSKNRLEIDLGWRNSNNVDAFKLTGLYQWVWNIDANFNWYAGAGGGIVSWSHDTVDANGTAIFIAGDVGIEYDFDIPLLISLDARPELGFGDGNQYDDLDFDIALSLRYQF